MLLDFPVLHDLKANGATDYYALGSRRYMATYVTDRPGGFTAPEIEELTGISPRLAAAADMFTQRAVAENVLKAHIGQTTGPRVLAGQIRRGTGEEIKAILWSSDLRGFTQLSDRFSGNRIITTLNAVFDAQSIATESHGGEILKFIGAGLLAIFPITEEAEEGQAAKRALAAAGEAFVAVRRALTEAMLAGEPPVRMVVALQMRDGHLRQYRRRRAARFHRDRPGGQPRQPGRGRGKGSRFADRGQQGFRSRLWRQSPLPRSA